MPAQDETKTSKKKNRLDRMIDYILKNKFQNPRIPKSIFMISSIIAIFFMSFKPPVDPDLFWHLKSGELIWQYKIIPQVDWFSYTMSGYPRVDYEWLSEILMYKIWDITGYFGLAIFFALLLVLTFGYLLPRSIGKNSPFYVTYIMMLLGTLVASITFGSRPQIFTLAGVALIFFIINRLRNDSQSRLVYFLPLIFLVWANFHGGFVLGLIFLAGFLLLEKHLISASARRPNGEWLKSYTPIAPLAWKKLAQVSIAAFAATFINPYTYRNYVEIYKSLSNTYNKDSIMEWLSPNFHSTEGLLFGFYVILVLIAVLLIKKVDILSFTLIPLSLFLAFQAYRNVPFFVIMSLPLLVRNFEPLEKNFAETFQKKFIALGFAAMLIIYPPIVLGTGNSLKTFGSEDKLAEFAEYPRKAIQFLEEHPDKLQKNIFNNYGWGGYMIGNIKCQMSDIKTEQLKCFPKVFIDGRMDYWKLSDRHILKDYNDIITIDDKWQDMADQYQIKIVFLNKNDYLVRSLASNPQWKKIYSDDISRIYEKAE